MELNAMKEREEICDVCHKMWQRGIVAANDGNVSVKLADGTFLCTPSGVSKAAMTPEILVHLAADGSVISAAEGYKPSSEMKMHFRCYAEREDVKAVVHAHPPVATSYASMGRALDGYQTMENIVNLGAVPVAPYAQPSTDEVPDSIAPFLQEHDAILLAHHGALTVGELSLIHILFNDLIQSACNGITATAWIFAVKSIKNNYILILGFEISLHHCYFV